MTTTLPQIALYTRTGCHLCEEAETLLARLSAELGVVAELTVINLTDEPEFEADYGQRVPVIEVSGVADVLEAPVREAELRQLLSRLPTGRRA